MPRLVPIELPISILVTSTISKSCLLATASVQPTYSTLRINDLLSVSSVRNTLLPWFLRQTMEIAYDRPDYRNIQRYGRLSLCIIDCNHCSLSQPTAGFPFATQIATVVFSGFHSTTSNVLSFSKSRRNKWSLQPTDTRMIPRGL